MSTTRRVSRSIDDTTEGDDPPPTPDPTPEPTCYRLTVNRIGSGAVRGAGLYRDGSTARISVLMGPG